MTLAALSTLSTSFVVASGVCLLLGWYFIRGRRNRIWHRNTMLTATALAGAFLVAYVCRWYLYGSKPFEGTGGWRVVYLSVLAPHILLAIVVGPLAVRLIWLALKARDFAAHRRLARWTLPIWLFVAASGWVVYYFLYGMDF